MIRSWLKDSGLILAGVGILMLFTPFTFGIGGIMVVVGIALLVTCGLFSVAAYAYNGVARTASGFGRRPHAQSRSYRHRHP